MMQEEVHQGSYLTVYFPPNNTALVFLVKGIANSNFRKFLYGALPLTQGQQISSYSGGTATVSGNGQFPANAFTEGPCSSGNTGSGGFACTSQIQALANDLMMSAPISTTISDAISLLECLVENNYIPVMDLIKAIARIEEQRLRKEL